MVLEEGGKKQETKFLNREAYLLSSTNQDLQNIPTVTNAKRVLIIISTR